MQLLWQGKQCYRYTMQLYSPAFGTDLAFYASVTL